MEAFLFRIRPGIKVKICCDLSYARWLVRTGRVVMGVWCGYNNTIYL
jgi:hypothetical protein